MNNKNEALIYLAIIIVAFIFLKEIKKMTKNFFGTFGIGSTTDDDKREAEISKNKENVKDFFNPNYCNDKGSILMTMKETDSIVKQIWDSIGLIYDDETETIGAFKKIKYKTQVSWIAKRFNELHKKDLLSWLDNKLDTDNQRLVFEEILSYTKKLKTGK